MTFSSGPVFVGNVGYAIGGQGNPADMSLLKNQPNQNFTFELIAAATDTGLTGQAANIVAWLSLDGGAQSQLASARFTELDSVNAPGMYNCAPAQAETNGDCISIWITCPNAVPFCLIFLTGGLHKNHPNQHIGFGMTTISGLADPSASPSVFASKDGGSPSAGGGSVTNLGNGQFDYLIPQAETNGTNVNWHVTAASDVPQNISIFTVP